MRIWMTYCFLLWYAISYSQVNYLPQHSFFKDQVFANKLNQPYNGGSFFPLTEREYDLIPNIIDSTPQYYDFTQTLFKKHLFEIEAKDCFITISPTFDFSGGRDLMDTVSRNLFQNTRGFHIEADLFDKFSFSTSFYENQARVTRYESDYYLSLGELYPLSSSYQTQNAVIPGGGRTKYFKTDGFDYAYAIGYFVYQPVKKVSVAVGNNQHFIGDGHRSLLLSDNAYSAPYFLVDWHIHPKLKFTYMRSRLLNLMRRPATGSVESYYESKGFSVNYITWQPTQKLNLSLFEGVIWNRGDSITSTYSHPLIYNPIPFVSSAVLDENEINALFGINIGYQAFEHHRVYGQFAINGAFDAPGVQIGYRGYNFFGLNDFMLQLEYNYVADGLYSSPNSRLNYVQFNLPMGHIRGDGLQEFILRTNYEFKRVYADISASYYILDNYDPKLLLPTLYPEHPATPESYDVLYTRVEVGYRFNRKMNFSLFAGATYRNSSKTDELNTLFFNAGIRTALLNHYKDF